MYRWRIGYGSRPAPALIPLAVLVLAGSLLFVLASQQPRVGEAGARVGGVGHGAISHGAIGHVAIQPRAGGTGGRAACGGSGYGGVPARAGHGSPREGLRGRLRAFDRRT
jgi:hypothetical protein